MFKNYIRNTSTFKKVMASLDNSYARDTFVLAQIKTLSKKSKLLDAGCGVQKYKKYCAHLEYKGQDFGQYSTDKKKMIGTDGLGGSHGYQYPSLDYEGDIWEIKEKDSHFDAVLCTEVLEHIPYPNETLAEFARLLKPGGKLILTAPSNCLRHMDPFFFYSGFSDRYYEKFLEDNNFLILSIEPVGDYYRWLSVEMARIIFTHSFFAKIFITPAFLYLYNKKKTTTSIDTLCISYHIVAIQK